MAVSTLWWGWGGWKLLRKIHSFKKQKSNWSKLTAWWIYWNWNYLAFEFHFSIFVHEFHESSCVYVEPWKLRITCSSVFFILICDDSQILNHQACQPNLVLPLEVPVWLPASIHGALSATSPAGNKTQDRYDEAGVFQLKKQVGWLKSGGRIVTNYSNNKTFRSLFCSFHVLVSSKSRMTCCFFEFGSDMNLQAVPPSKAKESFNQSVKEFRYR